MIVDYLKDTFNLPIQVADTEGNGIDFTGSTIQFTLAVHDSKITESTEGVSVTKDSIGNILIEISASVMKTIPPGIYEFEVRVIYADLTEDTLFFDTLKLLKGVQRT